MTHQVADEAWVRQDRPSAAARLGASVSFLGCIGGDSFGDVVTASLVRSGVDVSGVRRVAAPTATARLQGSPATAPNQGIAPRGA